MQSCFCFNECLAFCKLDRSFQQVLFQFLDQVFLQSKQLEAWVWLLGKFNLVDKLRTIDCQVSIVDSHGHSPRFDA